MAFKVSFFMFACIGLLVASKATALLGLDYEEMVYDDQTPLKQLYDPGTAAIMAPTSAPTTAPAYSTPSSRTHLGYCVPQCQQRCIMLRDQHKILRKIRPCVHVCTACCAMNMPVLCVPGPGTTCPLWDSVIYHGGLRQCP